MEALIRAAYDLTGDNERAHGLGWQIAGMVADAANLLPVQDEERGCSLAMLNDTRGQAAMLRAIDVLIGERRS